MKKLLNWFGFFKSNTVVSIEVNHKDFIQEHYSFILDYIAQIDKFIEEENERLRKLNSKLSEYFRFTETLNTTPDLIDYVANFNNRATWVYTLKKPLYIKYDPTSTKLLLREGYLGVKDPILGEIKTVQDLSRVYKRHFSELQRSLLLLGISYFENLCTEGSKDELEICGGSEGIKDFYQELQKSINNIILRL